MSFGWLTIAFRHLARKTQSSSPKNPEPDLRSIQSLQLKTVLYDRKAMNNCMLPIYTAPGLKSLATLYSAHLST